MGEERTCGPCLQPLPDGSINGEEETCGSCSQSSLDGYTELKKQNTPDTGGPLSQPISPPPKGSDVSFTSSDSAGEVHRWGEQIHVGPAITDVVPSPSMSGLLKISPSVDCVINLGQDHNETRPGPSRNHQAPSATQPWAKVIMAIVSTLVVGLLSINYTVNSKGNLMPANLFSTRPASFGFFLVVVSVTFYVAMMAMIIRPTVPRVAEVLNIVTFACVVLGVTVLLWSLFPRSFSYVPWIFFGATIFILLGVILYE